MLIINKATFVLFIQFGEKHIINKFEENIHISMRINMQVLRIVYCVGSGYRENGTKLYFNQRRCQIMELLTMMVGTKKMKRSKEN